MATKKKAASKSKSSRCWAGFEPVPGKKAFSKGSCKPKAKSGK